MFIFVPKRDKGLGLFYCFNTLRDKGVGGGGRGKDLPSLCHNCWTGSRKAIC
jgi:hypothetical protein